MRASEESVKTCSVDSASHEDATGAAFEQAEITLKLFVGRLSATKPWSLQNCFRRDLSFFSRNVVHWSDNPAPGLSEKSSDIPLDKHGKRGIYRIRHISKM